MLRGAQRGSALLRSAAAAGTRGRSSRAIVPAADARAGWGLAGTAHGPKSQGAFGTVLPGGQARWMSAAAPGSADEKKDESEPKPGGFLSKLMSKESCVVSVRVERRKSCKRPKT